jgi:serine/threonine-protein kinase RsbW
VGGGPIESECPEKSPAGRSFSLGGESELTRVRRAIASDLMAAGASSEVVFDCLVAVTEACSNALRHGGSDAAPDLSWRIERGEVCFDIRDYATVRWSGGARLASADGIHERVGGFGLELMKRLMDSVEIRTGPAGTTVGLSKRL